MSHPWLSAPNDIKVDTQKIIIAKKLAYLLCPSRARLRLVDLETEGEIDEDAAIDNLKRYNTLLPEYPMIFAVENARQSAPLTLKEFWLLRVARNLLMTRRTRIRLMEHPLICQRNSGATLRWMILRRYISSRKRRRECYQ